MIVFYWLVSIQDIKTFTSIVASKKEEEKSRKTLQLALPRRIIGQLKMGEFVIAESIPDCTIGFIGIMSFGKHATLMSPQDLLALLNKVFRRFDALVDKRGVFKVETVGSICELEPDVCNGRASNTHCVGADMIASGLPEPTPDHCRRVCLCALDILHSLEDLHWPDNLEPVEIKIGINSGKVVAGVIGDKLPRCVPDSVSVCVRGPALMRPTPTAAAIALS